MNSASSGITACRPEKGWVLRKILVKATSALLCAGLFQAGSTALPLDERGKVTGMVVDQSGAPIPRAFVSIRSEAGQNLISALTDAEGRFDFELAEGKYELDAGASGMAPLQRQPLEVGAGMPPLTLTLSIPSITEQIVVTATRTDTLMAQLGSSTTVIRGVDLEREGIGSIADALRRTAGLHVVQSGIPGQLTSLFLRGGESDYIKVLIDGIPVNEPGGSFNFANLSPSSIDRIEIVRGPQSALFGSDAMAGVIQIFTKRGTAEGLGGRPHVAFEGGSFHTLRYEAGLDGKGESLDYSASFARLDTDNNVRNGSYNNETISGNLGYQFTPNARLRAVFRSDAGRAGVPGQWGFHRPDPDQFYRHRSLAGGITFTHLATPRWAQTLSYTIHDSREYSENADSGSYVARYGSRVSAPQYDFPYETLSLSRRQKIEYQTEHTISHALLVSAGVEVERETGSVGEPGSPGAKRVNYGGFLQEQWFLHRDFFVSLGVRLEHNESYGFSASPRVSVAWLVNQPSKSGALGLTKIRANYGLGTKEPTLVESSSRSPYFPGNPDLEAERSLSFDVGIEQQFRNGEGFAEVTYFDNRFRNQIGFVVTDFTTFTGSFFNIGRTRARGMEINFRQTVAKDWQVAGSYTFLDSLILENQAVIDPIYAPGSPLPRRPRHTGSLGLKWMPGRWTLGAAGTVVGSRPDTDFLGLGLQRSRGYGFLDLLLSFRLLSGVTVFAVVNNALDRSYMEVLGYPALPARFRIGLRTDLP